MTDHTQQIAKDEERLDELGEDIDKVRRSLPEEKAAREEHFIDDGRRSDHVDNTIVPPG